MRIQDTDIVTASCYNTMEGKDLSGAAVPTDIKLEPTNNDAANSNGILSPPTTPSNTTPAENEYASASAGSGRFKFFKDGKFILELWHHRDGDRTTWYTPKSTTVWPPAGPCTPRQESSTSLSVSDDNSSIQSSPWQRDHCWKQNIPRKNVNRQLEFAMTGSRKWKARFASITTIRRRRRKPYDPIKPVTIITIKKEFKEESADEIDGRTSSSSSSSSLSWPPKKRILNQNCAAGDRVKRLAELAQKLLERKTYEHAVSSCRTDPGIVSPRKRILKEMEKVSLEEMGNANKKHRAKTTTSFNAMPCSTVTVMTGTVHGQTATASHTAISPISTATTTTKSANSHSISSILSRDEEPSFLRNLLKSPNEGSATSETKNTYGESPNNIDVRNSRLSHSSTPVGASPSPPYPSSKGIHCPQPLQPYIPPAYMFSGAPGSPFLPSPPPPPPPISNHPPYYAYPWSVPAVSSLPRQSMYPAAAISSYPGISPSPWVPIAHSSMQSYPVTENGTDVPLNLSKH